MEEAKEEEDVKDVTIVEDKEDECTTDEIMQLVESSSPSPKTKIDGGEEQPSFKVRFIDDPYAIPEAVTSYSGYITIDVNEESCGSSFSDSEASVMASVDMNGLFCGGAWRTREMAASDDEYEWDDDSLARFLGEDCGCKWLYV